LFLNVDLITNVLGSFLRSSIQCAFFGFQSIIIKSLVRWSIWSKVALRENGWDYAVEAIKGPGSILDGIDLLDNITVYYTSTSLNLKYEQENYSRKIDKYGVVLEDPKDLDNHLIDPTRYIGLFLSLNGVISRI